MASWRSWAWSCQLMGDGHMPVPRAVGWGVPFMKCLWQMRHTTRIILSSEIFHCNDLSPRRYWLHIYSPVHAVCSRDKYPSEWLGLRRLVTRALCLPCFPWPEIWPEVGKVCAFATLWLSGMGPWWSREAAIGSGKGFFWSMKIVATSIQLLF